ncbi:ATP synthase F0 subunit B [Hippea sp. KM1]|uniref:ATP synthase F0 subunit B n=1 Tax=Hippea sp. KM1 TaxID=944481 RepID=UPI00046D09E2|nr:ATP synthase F0 subunit B [Hippea sp. KM1]
MINIDSTLFMQMVAFGVVLVLLNAILYKPLLEKIRERLSVIDEFTKTAESLRQQAEKNEQEYSSRLDEAEKQAKASYSKIVNEALKEKEETLSSESRKAFEEIGKFEEEVKKEIEIELASSKDYSIELSNKIYKQLVG